MKIEEVERVLESTDRFLKAGEDLAVLLESFIYHAVIISRNGKLLSQCIERFH